VELGIVNAASVPKVDDAKRNVSCFLKVAKVGETKITFTPIGQNGKARYSETVVFTCVELGTNLPPSLR
jgi:hypothetical protein